MKLSLLLNILFALLFLMSVNTMVTTVKGDDFCTQYMGVCLSDVAIRCEIEHGKQAKSNCGRDEYSNRTGYCYYTCGSDGYNKCYKILDYNSCDQCKEKCAKYNKGIPECFTESGEHVCQCEYAC